MRQSKSIVVIYSPISQHRTLLYQAPTYLKTYKILCRLILFGSLQVLHLLNQWTAQN